jgi:hypothetical protein
MKCHYLSLHARAEQGDGNNSRIAKFLTVAAKHCRQAEHQGGIEQVCVYRKTRVNKGVIFVASRRHFLDSVPAGSKYTDIPAS